METRLWIGLIIISVELWLISINIDKENKRKDGGKR